MTQEITVRDFDELGERLKRDMREVEDRVKLGVRKAAREQRNYMVRETMPKAFGDLISSLMVVDTKTGSNIVADAPYAAAVEIGSRPHTPPLEPLIRWVKLRGMQGLSPTGGVRSAASMAKMGGATTVRHARSVASTIRDMGVGGAVDVDVPEQIARAIQHAISVNGTKPQWYARKSLPQVTKYLDQHIPEQLHRPL